MQTLTWYCRRLSHMSPGEIALRCGRQAAGAIERLRPVRPAGELAIADVCDGPCSAERFAARPPLLGHDLAAVRLADWPEDARRRCIAEADELLDHRMSVFQLEGLPFGPEICWNRNPLTGRTIPLAFAPRINYRDPAEVGDVKYIWEPNRHQHLVRLGQAHVLTGDDRYAAEVVGQITSWIDQCPCMRGVNWTSPLEAGLRLISWALAFELVRRSPAVTDEFAALLCRSVHQQAEFIDRRYSPGSSANNHLIGEAAGALVAAACWPELRRAGRWHRRARKILIRECLRQNAPDGVNREQAFGYQLFVFDLLLLPAVLGGAAGRAFPPAYWRRLEKMAEFVAWVCDCGGNLPNVGDGDDGAAFRLGGRPRYGGRLDRQGCEDLPARSLLHTAAAAFGRGEFRAWAGGGFDEKPLWLFGPAGAALSAGGTPAVQGAAVVPTAAPARASRCFRQGGYCVFRGGAGQADEAVMVFDCGPLGLAPLAGHGHADALSVTLSLAGREVLIDPGTFAYPDGPRRVHFKATARHNTLCFDDVPPAGQARYEGAFMWGASPRVALGEFSDHAGSARAAARVTWPAGQWHRRIVHWTPQAATVVIQDAWTGRHPPVIRFCMAPELLVRRDAPEGQARRAVAAAAGLTVNVRVEGGALDIEPAECSRHYGQLQRTSRIVIRPRSPAGKCTTVIRWEIGHARH